MKLELDGAALEMGGREFQYTLPAKWGPNEDPAFLNITALPAASVNASFRKALDDVMHKARVRDFTIEEEYKKTKDVEKYIKGQEDNLKWVGGAIASLRYDECIQSWETNIQNAGKSMDANRENFVELAQYEHPDIQAVFEKMQADLSDFDQFSIQAESKAEAKEVKN